ncbi:apolipoprotein N-acyltransferase [Pseudodesulfovibrio pelocollis]|uniref:apolipoprotein N-acyltransferase n=1 Tax=Pseudodesulfovibrio pelocollis TaxID=3051432 RepID=UPI00255A72C8|nr:apolipoprotein N-acyltransferase [Pseudodesulfovibrio sp. SB368]
MPTLVLLATLGAWLGFANPLLHLPLAALAFPLGLAWIGLRATSGRRAFRTGWLAGTLAATGCFYWMVIPVQLYGGLPWYVALPCPALLAAVIAIYYGLFSLAMHHAGRFVTGVPLCLLAGLSWASMEMLTGVVLSGFPWMNLAAAFAPWPFAVQGAAVIGAYGLSGLLAALAVAWLLYSTYRSALILAVALTLGLTGFGLHRVSTHETGPAEFTVSMVQGNVDQSHKWEPDLQRETIEKYADLTLRAIRDHAPTLVVWPETAAPFYLQEPGPLSDAVRSLARDTRTPIITGSPAYRVTDMERGTYVLYNRAWLVDDAGRILSSYDKEHLVPFGEYMPLEEWVPFEKLVQAVGDFVPGTGNRPLMVDTVALGVLICYEGIFPELAQKQVARGATALLNLSNDAWFGDTSAPRQHLNLTVLRAVEQGRWLVRCTNTGISAFIDPVGRIAARGAQFEAETLSHAIAPMKGTTLFHKAYPWIGPGIHALTMLGFVLVGLRARKQRKG